MNKKYAFVIGIISFVILFYQQEPGINLSIFAIIVWMLTYQYFKKNTGPHFWKFSFTLLLSSVSWAWYGDGFSLIALCLSLTATAFHARYPRLKFLLFPLTAAITLFSFPFRIFLLKEWMPDSLYKKGFQRLVATAIIPIILVGIFASVYATGSDSMKNFFLNLSLNFSPGLIILLSLFAFFILFNLWFLWLPTQVFRLNAELDDQYKIYPNSVLPSLSFFSKSLHTRGGIISFSLLNLLLLFFVCTYTYEQFFMQNVKEVISESVHDRIATVIGSIILAILLVLVYFKSPSQKDRDGRLLTWLAYLWISLNGILIAAAFLKNSEYMMIYGLTFKRISVYIFLVLCVIGLFFTIAKINRQKTNAYLFNKMSWAIYWVVILLAPVNFSYLVTKYNLNTGKEDAAYFQNLPFNKNLLLREYAHNPEWAQYVEETVQHIKQEKDKPFLSKILYYHTISLPYQEK